MNRLRLVVLALIASLPSPIAIFFLKLFFGYRIGKRVRIGFSIIDAAECEIGDDVSIGHLNFLSLVTIVCGLLARAPKLVDSGTAGL